MREKEQDLTTGVPLLTERGLELRRSQVIFNLCQRLFLLLATPHPAKSRLPQSLGPDYLGLDLGAGRKECCA